MYVLDIDVTRNGNNLKLKVKSEFSLSMGLMVINHSNPYNTEINIVLEHSITTKKVSIIIMLKPIHVSRKIFGMQNAARRFNYMLSHCNVHEAWFHFAAVY